MSEHVVLFIGSPVQICILNCFRRFYTTSLNIVMRLLFLSFFPFLSPFSLQIAIYQICAAGSLAARSFIRRIGLVHIFRPSDALKEKLV